MGFFDRPFGGGNKKAQKVKLSEKKAQKVELLWSYKTGDEVNSVAIGDGYVAAGSADYKVYLFDYSGKLLWSYETGDEVHSVVIGDGYVAAGSGDKKVYLFDYSGKLLWSYETGKYVESVAIGDGYVAAGGGDKKVYLFDYSGKLLWSYETGYYVWSVTIGDGYVAAGSLDNKVYLFDYSGKLLWSYETGYYDSYVFSVTIGDGYVAAGSQDNKVYLFDYSGKLLWSYATDEDVESVAIGDGYVAAGSVDNKVYLFDYSGKLLWSYKTGSTVHSVAIGGGYVAAGSLDKKVYLFDHSGKLLWSYEAGNEVLSVAIGDGYVAAGSEDSTLHVVSNPSLIDNQIKSAESVIADAEKIGCDVTEPQKVLNEARSALSAGNYSEGITIAKSCIAEAKRLQADARPEITLELTKLNFRPNYWEKVDIILKNTGTAHAKAIGLSFSKEVEVKGLREVDLNIGGDERLSITLMPKNAGDIPLEADIKYQDMLGREYQTKTEFILNVGEAIREEISPKKISAQLPEELAQDYQDIQLIGQGGFAKVFKAVREKDRKEIAIKIPIALDQATGTTFMKEIENWTRLNHPNIVKIYNHNILPIPFFEMELCDESLDEYLKQNRIDLKNAVWIIFNTAEGLKLAHSLKIIHKDLKPHNILLKDGVPKITDWGLSKVMTQSSSSKGGYTPHYAAPEQIDEKKKDERTDIWQLGVIFYQMTTGKLPFDGETMTGIMMSILTKEPVRPSELNSEIDAELDKIILKSLSKAPEDRYQSVRELQMDLAKYLQISLKEELFKSKSAKDVSNSAYYCADLFLVCLKINDKVNACKYIEDLIGYAKGDTKDGLIRLRDGIEYRIEKKMDIPGDIVAQADILVHKIRIGKAG